VSRVGNKANIFVISCVRDECERRRGLATGGGATPGTGPRTAAQHLTRARLDGITEEEEERPGLTALGSSLEPTVAPVDQTPVHLSRQLEPIERRGQSREPPDT